MQVLLLNMCNTLRAFCLPGGLIKLFSARGTENIAGLWFARVDQHPG